MQVKLKQKKIRYQPPKNYQIYERLNKLYFEVVLMQNLKLG